MYAYTLVKIAESKKVRFTVVGDGGKNYTLDFTSIVQKVIRVQDELGRIHSQTKIGQLAVQTLHLLQTLVPSFEVVVRQLDYFAEVENSTAGSGEFGTSIDCDYEGGRLVVGASQQLLTAKQTVVKHMFIINTLRSLLVMQAHKHSLQSLIYKHKFMLKLTACCRSKQTTVKFPRQ